MLKHILAAVDFSPAWPQLQAHLARLPALGCQRVTLAYVIAAGYTQAPEVSHREHYEKKLAEIATRLKQDTGLEVDWTVRVGSVPRELIAAAEERGAETILAGTQGHGVIRELLLGSTVLDLARLADRPMLLARINSDEPRPLDNICRPLLATDGSAAASGAEAAFLRFLPHCATGVVVSVGPWQQSTGQANGRASIEEHIRGLRERAGKADAFDVELVEQGRPSAEIVRVAEERGADLIIVGRRGHNRMKELLLGSTAEGVCRASHQLVLLVPAAPA